MKFLKKFGLIFSFLFLLLLPAIVLADAQTGVCTDRTVSAETVGVFMQGICNECWEQGNCSLTDIMTVIANIGNFILSIIGALVLLVYVIGGFFWIASHGDKAWVDKGKKWIGSATFGLIIVLFAYTGVVALKFALVGQVSDDYVICDGTQDGEKCDVNSKCSGFSCISNCSTFNGFCVDEASVKALEDNGEASCDSTGEQDCTTPSQWCCYPISTTSSTSSSPPVSGGAH